MPINEQLRQHRIRRNWRQQDVAKQLDIAPSTLLRWEQGTHYPRAYYRAKLCALFGLSSQELGLVDDFPLPQESEGLEAEQQHVDLLQKTGLWVMPYVRNPHFTGREGYLDHLTKHFAPTGLSATSANISAMALPQSYALKGLGGIGKTQIAVEYAYRAHEQERYTYTIWITATNEETIISSFMDIIELLPSLSTSDETDGHKLVATAIHWLEQCPQPWLLIVDHVNSLSLVQSYLPRIGNGCILFTTQASAVSTFAPSLEVDNLSVAESTQFLLRRTGWHGVHDVQTEKDAMQLAMTLVQFPLALDQAGAYIEETACNFSTYLQLYKGYQQELLAQRGTLTMNYPESVATTWLQAFQNVTQTNQAVADLLCLCAFLAPDHIPEELLTEAASLWSSQLQQAMTDPLFLNQALKELRAFSLMKRQAEDHFLSCHRLVQVVHRACMHEQDQHFWVECVVQAIAMMFPDDPTNVGMCQRYFEQAESCVRLIEERQLRSSQAAEVCNRLGAYLCEQAKYADAEALYLQALAIREHVLGRAHLDTINTLHHIAILYTKWGKYEQAEPFYRRTLTIRPAW